MKQADLITPDESQKQVCAKYGVPSQAPEDMVAIALGTLHKSPIYGTRVKLPEGGTISWFIHCGEHSPASGFYQALHTGHLMEELPEVVKYLFLPEGAKFIIDREGYEDVWMAELDPTE
ncbi:hypothetical protein FQ192_12025 [Pseudomonas sp. ANT_J12]|uniref:immunity protein Imm33 domain-containing protein n=1 Tax=Pseudomonas sp. ANT_J12 TaxID=2597351 RepID=UPI0011F29EBE|nr:hypothetical protein [Pseudomonas sp. ANT_J12]KAA0994844.1 hypothetical protein FQ192_12025 [Pseudomonas sp. ANT_J12]